MVYLSVAFWVFFFLFFLNWTLKTKSIGWRFIGVVMTVIDLFLTILRIRDLTVHLQPLGASDFALLTGIVLVVVIGVITIVKKRLRPAIPAPPAKTVV